MCDELLRCLRGHSQKRGCADNCICVDAYKRGFATCSEELAKLAADAIEELLAERDEVNADSWKTAFEVERDEHRWIPVTERLPCLNTPVLATDGIEVDISWMYGVPPRWITSFTAIDEDKLTHWMPLPQTPKGE